MTTRHDITGDEVLRRLESENGTTRVELAGDDLRLTLEIADLDRLGVAVSHLEMAVPLAPSPLQEDREQRSATIAAILTHRLTYLLEKLELVEWDRRENHLLIRSTPPHRNAEGIAYYEAKVLEGSSLSLDRYVFCAEKRIRTPRAMHFTREVFARLIDDLAEGMRGG